MEKVTSPKEVAEAIEEIWSEIPGRKGPVDSLKITWLTNWRTLDECFPEYEPILIEYFKENPIEYVTALENGFDVEKSPYEELREYYETNEWYGKTELAATERQRMLGRQMGVSKTLNTLGIEIEGINV